MAGSGHSFTGAALTGDTLLLLDRLDRVLDVDRASGPRAGRGRHHARGPRRGARRARARAPQPGRHRRPDARRRPGHRARTAPACATPTCPRRSRRWSSCWRAGRSGRSRAADGDLLRAARVGLGTLGAVVAVTLRCVPAFALHGARPPRAARGRAGRPRRRAPSASTTSSSGPSRTPTSRSRARTRATDDRARAAVRGCASGRARSLVDNGGFDALCRAGRRFPAAIPMLNRAARARRHAARARRPLLPRLRQPAARALHGDGVRAAARARRARRCGPSRPSSSAIRSPSRSSCASRPPTTRCSRPPTAATACTSPSTPTRACRGRRPSARWRRCSPAGTGARTGASAPFLDGGRARAAPPGLGGVAGGPGGARSRRRVHEPLGGAGPRAGLRRARGDMTPTLGQRNARPSPR